MAEGAPGQESKSVVRFPILLSSVVANTERTQRFTAPGAKFGPSLVTQTAQLTRTVFVVCSRTGPSSRVFSFRIKLINRLIRRLKRSARRLKRRWRSDFCLLLSAFCLRAYGFPMDDTGVLSDFTATAPESFDGGLPPCLVR